MMFIKAKKISVVRKVVIYSKNSKRRYSREDFSSTLPDNEIYNRFLKSITCRVRPIQIVFEDYDKFDGEWREDLV